MPVDYNGRKKLPTKDPFRNHKLLDVTGLENYTPNDLNLTAQGISDEHETTVLNLANHTNTRDLAGDNSPFNAAMGNVTIDRLI
jgi:hypothetical protein